MKLKFTDEKTRVKFLDFVLVVMTNDQKTLSKSGTSSVEVKTFDSTR